jgi:adenine/guanine phosphoribosyltransferase-like PRPP-binding protein
MYLSRIRKRVWCGASLASLSRTICIPDGYLYQDSFEMQEGAIAPGASVVIVDDLIATGAPNSA